MIENLRVISVVSGSERYSILYVNKLEQLVKVKRFDDEMFGPHQGITLDELKHVAEAGYVFVIHDESGEIIAESQIILRPIEEHPHLNNDEAYCYGTAVRPDLRGEGLARRLFAAQEHVARETEKTRMTLTVRPENARSVRARLKQGFLITGYDRNRYGPMQNGGSRLLMTKFLNQEPVVFNPTDLVCSMQTNRPEIVDRPEMLAGLKTMLPTRILVPINVGDQADIAAQRVISHLINNDYTGIALLKPEEIGLERSTFVFDSNHHPNIPSL